ALIVGDDADFASAGNELASDSQQCGSLSRAEKASDHYQTWHHLSSCTFERRRPFWCDKLGNVSFSAARREFDEASGCRLSGIHNAECSHVRRAAGGGTSTHQWRVNFCQ